MKKLNIIYVIIFIMLVLASCAPKGPEYLKEYSYLPVLGDMTVVEQPKTNEGGFLETTYEVKNYTYDNVLGEYEKVLVKDGWKITNDNKPGIITAEKGEYQAIFIPRTDKDKLLLVISANK